MNGRSVYETHWAIFRFAALVSASYVVWLVTFERWLEPWLRRRGGALLSCSIVWVPAGGSFRVWGVQECSSGTLNATVGVLGGGTVLLSAVLPVVALMDLVARATYDAAIAASSYLASLPMIAFFAFRVLSRRAETGRSY